MGRGLQLCTTAHRTSRAEVTGSCPQRCLVQRLCAVQELRPAAASVLHNEGFGFMSRRHHLLRLAVRKMALKLKLCPGWLSDVAQHGLWRERNGVLSSCRRGRGSLSTV